MEDKKIEEMVDKLIEGAFEAAPDSSNRLPLSEQDGWRVLELVTEEEGVDALVEEKRGVTVSITKTPDTIKKMAEFVQ